MASMTPTLELGGGAEQPLNGISLIERAHGLNMVYMELWNALSAFLALEKAITIQASLYGQTARSALIPNLPNSRMDPFSLFWAESIDFFVLFRHFDLSP